MKQVWYLYQNGVNFGQRCDGITALNEIAKLSNKELPPLKSILLAKGYYRSGEYEAIKESIKQ